jgi:protein-disulfide isomerase
MRKEREKADKRQRNMITVGIVVIVIALVAAGGWAIKSASDDRKAETKVIQPKGATPEHGIPYTSADAGGQSSSNPVKVVLYEDFQCPVCQAFEQANGQFLDQKVKSGEIEIEYRILNFLDRSSQNQYSSRAGNAAICAFESGGGEAYKKVHDLLYANQPQENTAGPEDNDLVSSLKSAGVEDADSCVLKHRFVPWIVEGTDQSRDDKVTGTPTVRIDGKDVKGQGGGIPQAADIQKAIDAAKKS